MFIRFCGETERHTSHTYIKHWSRGDIPDDMPSLVHLDELPNEWDSPYRCLGSKDTWKVEMMHPEGCSSCEDCVESAILHARLTGSTGATYSSERGGPAPDFIPVVEHSATVARG